MNPRKFFTVTLAAALLLAIAAVSQSQDKPAAAAAPSPEEQAKMMEVWMKLAEPGEPHKRLAGFVGEWDVAIKMFMAGPDGPAEETKGSSSITSVLGGRFIEERVKSSFNIPGPDGKEVATPWEGMGLTGYDNYKKAYVSTWADSMGTVLLVNKGTDNPQKPDEMTFYGEMDEPALGLQDRLVKYHKKIVSKDKFVFSMYDLAVGEDYKVMELTYTRRK